MQKESVNRMEIYELHHPYNAEQLPTEPAVLVLGFFDGVHRGHQALIAAGKAEAEKRGHQLAVMTFNQHPSIVFQKQDPETMQYLTSVERKAECMAALGVDLLYVVDFTSAFAHLKPQEFVDQYIVGLHASVVVAGFDYTYGVKAQANMETLPLYAQNRFSIRTIAKQELDDQKISSTRIREELAQGKLEKVNQLLGYVYQTAGVVVHGDARGRTLGFPTANIQISQQTRLPKLGIYAVRLLVGNQWYDGMASIGYNITFEADRELTLEIYILDFNQDIYGEYVRVEWYHYLRSEVKFTGIEGLIAQLKEDEKQTKNYFSTKK